jgi:protein TonB
MPLSDFMPYGAPELLEGASPRMARSTFTASVLVAAMVCGLGLVTASRSGLNKAPGFTAPRREFKLDEFQLLEPLQPSPPAPPKVHVEGGDYRPVDVERPSVPIADPSSIGSEASSDRGEPDAVGQGTDTLAPPAEPRPDEYVYSDELPQLVRSVKPLYPDLAREAGVEGTVKLQLLIGLDGRVRRVIVRPGGSVPMLDEAAKAAALQCVFTPALANNRPVMVWVTQDYRFKLH